MKELISKNEFSDIDLAYFVWCRHHKFFIFFSIKFGAGSLGKTTVLYGC
jgi:hypothetical protein